MRGVLRLAILIGVADVLISRSRSTTQLIHTSVHRLVELFLQEKEYVEDLRQIVGKGIVSANAVGGLGVYIAGYDDVVGNQVEDETFMHNPLNAYHLLRHIGLGWPVVEEVLGEEKARLLEEGDELPGRARNVLSRSKRHLLPGADDVNVAAAAIAVLHDYYRFNASSFVNHGVFETNEWRFEGNGDVSVWDAFKVGVKGCDSMLFASGIEIMKAAQEKAKRDGDSSPSFVEPLDAKVRKNLIKTAKTVHDLKLDNHGYRSRLHSTNPLPFDRRLARKKKFAKAARRENDILLHDHKIAYKPQAELQFVRLCRGEELRPPTATKLLACKYFHGGKPYYFYGPRKVEVVSLEPYIALVHEFITDSEANELIEKAAPRLRLPGIPGTNHETDGRHQFETTWLQEKDSVAAAKLTKRLNYFLDVEAGPGKHSEPYQVINYGVAGRADMFLDSLHVAINATSGPTMNRLPVRAIADDRYAAVTGYLSDVAVGGNTGFPLAGAYVRPRKGTIAVWWNMDEALGYDLDTFHGHCPVVMGNKWIVNKWIRSNGLMFKRPCPRYTNRQLRGFRTRKMRRGGLVRYP